MNIFLGGVNGSGKTTILQGIHELRPEWNIVKGSQRLMEQLGIPGDYDTLRATDPLVLKRAIEIMMKTLLKEGSIFPHQIVDSHFLNLNYGVVYQVADTWIAGFDALVLLSVPAEKIFERMKKDTHRDRALFSKTTAPEEEHAILEAYIQETEKEFLHLAQTYTLPHRKIENTEKDQAIAELIQFIESLS